MKLYFSIIIPVYNRPEEIEELLNSLVLQTYKAAFEVIIVEDGSEMTSDAIVAGFSNRLNIHYFSKENTGPGDSRNFGTQKAQGNYFIFMDSDCILPVHYLKETAAALQNTYLDGFGGPDTAHPSFSKIQKAINYAMTSFITTGGIRGNRKTAKTFQPRSFNMGISKAAFDQVGGFGKIHPGEDPDLSIRLLRQGYKLGYIAQAFVYHKRRISWRKFYHQVYKFGIARAILNKRYPETQKITYWFPSFFWGGLLLGMVLLLLQIPFLVYGYLLFFLLMFAEAFVKSKSIGIACLSVYAVCIQFFAYGKGFIKATWAITCLNKKPEKIFPNMFFKP